MLGWPPRFPLASSRDLTPPLRIRICVTPATPYVSCERGQPQEGYSGYQVRCGAGARRQTCGAPASVPWQNIAAAGNGARQHQPFFHQPTSQPSSAGQLELFRALARDAPWLEPFWFDCIGLASLVGDLASEDNGTCLVAPTGLYVRKKVGRGHTAGHAGSARACGCSAFQRALPRQACKLGRAGGVL
jgi:hypothetical protein